MNDVSISPAGFADYVDEALVGLPETAGV